MATSRSLEEFSRRIQQVKHEVLANAEANVKKAAARALQVAVFATRVDTGRARGGWLVSIGQADPQGGADHENDKEGQKTINDGTGTVVKWKTADRYIILENNVDYIIYLDEGGPHVGPDNMTKKAVQAALDYLRRSSLLNVRTGQ